MLTSATRGDGDGTRPFREGGKKYNTISVQIRPGIKLAPKMYMGQKVKTFLISAS